MGLFSKVTSNKNPPSAMQKLGNTAKKEREANVLHNPSAYLAYGGDGVDRGAMMAQQAATRTHQIAVAANMLHSVNNERLPPPRDPHPLPALQNLGKSTAIKLGEADEAAVASLNFSSHKKTTELYVPELLSPEWRHAFEQFGFDGVFMSQLKAGWHDAMKQQMAMAVQTYKRESNIPKNALLFARDSAARATGRYVTRCCMYNGITIAIRGKFDNERKEAYFEFTVPTSTKEFVAWRNALMMQYNPMRKERGLELIRMSGVDPSTIRDPLGKEIAINGLP